MEDKDEMKEGMYLDAMDQLQKKFNENEEVIEKLKAKNTALLKDIISAYGVIRLIDNYIEPDEISYEVKTLIDCLRGHLSDIVEQKQTVNIVVMGVEDQIAD
tara:strand:+ start:1058 stop:1363 length:306 start_codon:yes stop_codon:yes gene_type:complete